MRIVSLSARRTGVTLAVGALALTSAACGSKSSTAGAGGGTTSSGAAATSATAAATSGPAAGASSAVATSSAPSAAAGGLPTSITIATDASYAPIESKASDGKTIVGVDPDLGAALGKALGIKVTFVNTKFDDIVAQLAAGRYNMAMSAMTDNKDREAKVDFVDYFSAGTSFMIKKGGKAVNTLDDLCGRKVAAEKGTTQVADATAQAAKCKKAGKAADTVQQYDDQNGANLALHSGRADVVMADSPVNAYAAQQSKGAFAITGTAYGTAPYGIAIPKKSTALRDAVATALQKLIDDGSYKTILTHWGVQAGAITKATVNGAAAS